ncbi:MAG TPA: response regulator [Candidatus Sulfotelmatobacter sp.]|nr:response regulator [Candidatus Sulfotelmatobacter sp.]
MARILVADDQATMRQIIGEMLREKGHTVTVVEDGQAAYESAQANDFDLIVADVNMPRLDGLEFLKKIKAAKPGLKVIFVTGMLEETIRIGSAELGLDGLIMKPFEKGAAVELIEKILAR